MIFIYKISLYVLPYGQMSLWGATVITNLMSAIPWVGQTICLSIVPVVTYLNSDTNKLSIIKDNKGKSGVYKWTNLENNNCYIGSSVNFYVRFSQYFNLNTLVKFRKNSLINKALLKYGYGNFSLEILEYCEPKDLISREQYYLDLIKPEYNILKIAGSSLGYRHTEETFIKFSQRTNEHRKGITFIQSEETKAKISKTLTGRKHTEETISKMIGKKGKIVVVTDLTTQVTTEYVSMRQAAIALNTSLATVREYVKNQKILKNKYQLVIK